MVCRSSNRYVGTVNEKLYDVLHGPKVEPYRQHEMFGRCELLRFYRGCPTVAFGYSRDFYSSGSQGWKEIR